MLFREKKKGTNVFYPTKGERERENGKSDV